MPGGQLRRVGLGLAVISFAVAILFALTPPSFHRSSIFWEPQSAEDSGSLQLARSSPEHLFATSTCDLARAGGSGESSMFETGSIELSASEGIVRLRSAADGPTASLELPPGSCTVTATYDHTSGNLTLDVGTTRSTVSIAPPEISGLYTSDPPAVDSVEITTQEVGLGPSWTRWGIGLASLALLAGAGLAAATISHGRGRGRVKRGLRTLRPAPVDWFVAVCLVSFSLVTPALLDDGWVVARTQALTSRFWFGNFFGTSDAWLPQGFAHELGFGVLQELGVGFAYVRVAVAALLFLTWLLLRRHVLAPTLGEAASRWPVTAVTYLAFAGAWLITVRAEPVVLFLGVVSLAVAVSPERCRRPGMVFLGLTAAGSAVATHQTGWVVLGSAVIILVSSCRAVWRDRGRALPMLTAVVAASTTVVLVAFAGADLATIRDGAAAFAASPESNYVFGPAHELDRYENLANSASARVFTILLLAIWSLGAAAMLPKSSPAARRLWLLAATWLLGLTLTSSKWEWHFAVYTTPAVLLSALTGAGLFRGVRLRAITAALLMTLLLVAVGACLLVPGSWNTNELRFGTWLEFSSLLLGSASLPWWLVAGGVSVTACFAVSGSTGRARHLATACLSIAILFPIVASLLWIAHDARHPGWSTTGANLRQLVGTGGCGVLDGASAVSRAEPVLTRTTSNAEVSAYPDGFPHVEGLGGGPLGGAVPAWGTGIMDDGTATAGTGRSSTPEFTPGSAPELTLWTAFGTTEGMSATVEFSTAGRAVSRTPISGSASPHWTQHTFDVPQGATSVRIEIVDGQPGESGWLAVSAPTTTTRAPAATTVSTHATYVSPYELTQYPCVRLPDLEDGSWPKVDYVVSTGGLDPDYLFTSENGLDLAAIRDMTITEVTCRDTSFCMYQLDYPMAEVRSTPTG